MAELALEAVVDDVLRELYDARTRFPAMRSAHEGYAILLEELDELKAIVWVRQGQRDVYAMRCEAVQVAAMAMRFALDVCDGGKGQL